VAENLSLSELLLEAYGAKRFQLSAPSWMDTERYNIVARVAAGASKDQFRLMLQHLLEDRFRLQARRVQKEATVFELTLVKGAPKFQESPAPEPDGSPESTPAGLPDASPIATIDKNGFPDFSIAHGARTVIMNGHGRLRGKQESMEQLANWLSNLANRPVTDSTGLKGKYEIELHWVMEPRDMMLTPVDGPQGAGSDPAGPTLLVALKEQLGLKLEQRKGTVEMIVVDHAERVPVEN
jgi:uncharacterized protein (TIGR03435 family)